MKKTINFIAINDAGYAELHGLKKLKKYVYCVPYVVLSEGYLLLITHKGNYKRSDCSRVKICDGNIIKDKRFVNYVKNHNLTGKPFVYNKKFKEYRL